MPFPTACVPNSQIRSVPPKVTNGQPALAAEVGDHPAVLPLLDLLDRERGQFPSPQRAADQKREDGVVALALEGRAIRHLEQFPRLLLGQPVPQTCAALPAVGNVGQVGC